MKLQKTALSIAILAGLGFAGQTFAQDSASAGNKEADDLDTVVVVGIRGSIEKSLESKREAKNRIEVVTSEDIGKMPDHNVADSLQRIAGVNISAASANEGAFDENDRVSMRGTSPSFTQTLIDGHNIGSGDWFVLNQSGTVGRSVSYSLLPSELVQKVEVLKSSEARLVEGGAVGNVNIVTRRPLNFGEGFSSHISLGAVHANLPGKTDPQLSALANWTNDARSFGVMVQAFSEERHLRRDGQELLGYEKINRFRPGTTDLTNIAQSNPDLIDVYYPTLIGSALFEQERKRTGGLVSAEFKPSDNFKFSLTGFLSRMKADNYNRNYMLWGSRILAQGDGQAPAPGYVVRNNTLVSATFTPDATRQYGIYDQISRPGAESSSNFISGDFQWDVSDSFRLSGQLGTSTGHGKTPTQDVAEWDVGLGSGAGWRLNGVGAADWNLGNTNTGAPGTFDTTMKLDWIFGFQDIDVVDKERWFKLDGETFINDSVFTSLQYGLREARHERSLANVVAQGPSFSATPGPFDPSTWPQGYRNYPGNFASGLGGNFPRNIWYYTPEQLAQFNRLTNRDPVSRRYFPAEYGLDERSTAAYFQANFEGEKWSGNFGVRYVRTVMEAANWVNTSATDPRAVTTSAFGPFRQDIVRNTYNDWLPSLNLRYSIDDNKLLRFAVSRTMTRPDYSAIAGAVSLSPPANVGGVGTGSGGNPNLEPILSTNFDATFEWYYGERALLSVSGFLMDIDNYVTLGNERRSYLTIDANNPNGAMVQYDLSIPVNSQAKVRGFEVAWEQPFGDYFGVFANYTFAKGDTDDGNDMLGTSRNTYNVGGYFENERFNARLNYTYRSEFFSGLDRASAFYQDEIDNVSASFGYKINDNYSIALDALNLNNPKTAYYAENRDRPRSIYQNGRQYYLTFRMKF
jgi:iron complex outermembrane receptor protein